MDNHEHKFTKKVRNDMDTKWLYLCEVCECQDGTKFWQELNDKWDFHYDFGKWLKNKLWTRI